MNKWLKELNQFIGHLTEFVTRTSVYAGICLSFGGVAGLLASWLDKPAILWFALGVFLPLGPVYLLYSSTWMVERRLRKIKSWREEKLITDTAYRDLRDSILEWYKLKITVGDTKPATDQLDQNDSTRDVEPN